MAIKKLRRWLRDQLNNRWRSGYGKAKNKGVHNETPYIHSENTYKTYVAQCNHFAEWCKELGVKDKDIAFKMIGDYGKYLESQGKSAWTIYTAICALAKAYGVSTKELGYEPPKRKREDIKRSRQSAKRDEHISATNNKELYVFGRCMGLRRSELEKLRGNQLVIRDDGTLYIMNVIGKGGKIRNVDLFGSEAELKLIKRKMQQAGEGLVFPRVHSALDEHFLRSIYACRAYSSKARNINSLTGKEKYICRKDKAGTIYDRDALLYTSKQLGHNRVDVVANSYLYNL